MKKQRLCEPDESWWLINQLKRLTKPVWNVTTTSSTSLVVLARASNNRSNTLPQEGLFLQGSFALCSQTLTTTIWACRQHKRALSVSGGFPCSLFGSCQPLLSLNAGPLSKIVATLIEKWKTESRLENAKVTLCFTCERFYRWEGVLWIKSRTVRENESVNMWPQCLSCNSGVLIFHLAVVFFNMFCSRNQHILTGSQPRVVSEAHAALQPQTPTVCAEGWCDPENMTSRWVFIMLP